MGVISTAKVVTGSDQAGKPKTTQSGNCEWVTVIETISTCGETIPLLIILQAVMHQAAWYKNRLSNDWSIAVSENGWTNNEIGFEWLVNVFNCYTKDCTIG